MSEIDTFPECDETRVVIHADVELMDFDVIETKVEDTHVVEEEDLNLFSSQESADYEIHEEKEHQKTVHFVEVEDEDESSAFSEAICGEEKEEFDVGFTRIEDTVVFKDFEGVESQPSSSSDELLDLCEKNGSSRKKASLSWWKRISGGNFRATRDCFTTIERWTRAANDRIFRNNSEGKKRKITADGKFQEEEVVEVIVKEVKRRNRIFILDCHEVPKCERERPGNRVMALIYASFMPAKVVEGTKLRFEEWTTINGVQSRNSKLPANARAVIVTQLSVVGESTLSGIPRRGSLEDPDDGKIVEIPLKGVDEVDRITWLDSSSEFLPVPELGQLVEILQGKVKAVHRSRNFGFGCLTSDANIFVATMEGRRQSREQSFWYHSGSSDVMKVSASSSFRWIPWKNVNPFDGQSVVDNGVCVSKRLGSASLALISLLIEKSFGSSVKVRDCEDVQGSSQSRQKRKHVVGTVVVLRWNFLLLHVQSKQGNAVFLRVNFEHDLKIEESSAWLQARGDLLGKRIQIRRVLELANGIFAADGSSDIQFCGDSNCDCVVPVRLDCFSRDRGWRVGFVGVLKGVVEDVQHFGKLPVQNCGRFGDLPAITKLLVKDLEYPSCDNVMVEVPGRLLPRFFSDVPHTGACVKLPVLVDSVEPSPWWRLRTVRCIALAAAVDES